MSDNINPKTNKFKKSNSDIDLNNLIPNEHFNLNKNNYSKKKNYKKKKFNNYNKQNVIVNEYNQNQNNQETYQYPNQYQNQNQYPNHFLKSYYNSYNQPFQTVNQSNQSTQTSTLHQNSNNNLTCQNASYYPNFYQYPMITNYSHNINGYSPYPSYSNNHTHTNIQYKNHKNNINQINQVLKEYLEDVNKINNEIKIYNSVKINQPEKVLKEFKWLKLDIKSLDDLIQISKDYGVKYSKDFEYQIDLEQLSSMINEFESLNKLVGLSNVKNQIVDIILYYSLKLDNKNYDLLHTVIEGDPGTGKTELAEKLAKIYLKMGILKKDIFKKVRRSDLIAGYLGQTAIKTEKVLEECKGGVLFIDEAYSLGNAEGKDGRDSFSKECIDMLNQWLTENKSEFVCIIAGYKDDLTKSFFSYNSGLERRFPIRFSIEEYTDEELAKIFIKKVKECEWDIYCENLNQLIKTNRKYFKFNGGDMEILFAKSKIAHSKNLLKTQDKKKKVLTEKDITDGIKIFLENPEIKKRGDDLLSKYLLSSMYN